MLTVTLVGQEEVIAKFERMNSVIHQQLLQFITGFALKLQAYVVQEKLQGQVLNHITGKLAGSIHNEVEDQQSSIIGRVYSSGINYAAIHEYGGEIPERRPVNAMALHWNNGGGDVFARFARGFTMPERSYLRSSLSDNTEDFISGAKEAINQAVKQ